MMVFYLMLEGLLLYNAHLFKASMFCWNFTMIFYSSKETVSLQVNVENSSNFANT